MSGSSRSMQAIMFSGLRVASTTYTPEYSKNGVNVNAKLSVDAYLNIASKANNGQGRQEVLTFTIWGGLANTCAKSMSKGKEFAVKCDVHTYKGKGFFPGVNNAPGLPIQNPDGTQNMQKKLSFTVRELNFGEESNKHVAREIQMQIRPQFWNVIGHEDQAKWAAILEARKAIVFNAQSPTFGYARVRMPLGENIGAYVPKNKAAAADGVAASFAGVNPAGTADASKEAVVGEGGFVTAPAGV